MREVLRRAGEVEKGGQRRKSRMPADTSGALGFPGQVEEGCQRCGVLPAAILADDLQTVRHEELRAFISFNGFSAQSARFKRRILRALNHQWDHDRRLSRLSQPFANPFEPKLFSLHRPGRSRRRPSWKWVSRRSALLTPRPQS